MTEIRTVVSFGLRKMLTKKRDKGASRALAIFYIFIRMGIIQVYTDVNTYQIVHSISVHLLIGMPYFKNNSYDTKNLGINIARSSHGSARFDS